MIIIGLGNHEERYNDTPHNIGFEIIDKIAEKNSFASFILSKKFHSLISESIDNGKKTILAKPQDYMNQSGLAVKAIKLFYKKDIIVIHDDIDLPIGTIRISKNRGSAGHKGVDSIIKEIGSKDFTRIRIGIQPSKGKPSDVTKYVLKKLAKNDQEKMIKEAVKTLHELNYC